jgi:FkbM family methyltransferase
MATPFRSIRDHTIFAAPIVPDSFVVDAGSNAGHFAHAMVAQFGCRVLALEPTPALAASYLSHDKIELIQAALAPSDGEMSFHLSDNPEASSLSFTPDVHTQGVVQIPALSLGTVLDRTPRGTADLFKMDIEGSEIAVLEGASDATLRRIGQLSVEFHDFMGHNTRAATEACIERVRRAGFRVHRYRDSTADVLFLNQRHHSWARYVTARFRHAIAVRRSGP